MTNTRAVAAGLMVVASCAVILSFSGLYNLALVCGFGERLAALVPVMADAGAATASAVWLGGDVTPAARRFARFQALALLGASVIGNAVAHALVAYQLRPHWLVVVLVGALAPAVLASTLHLRSLVKAGGGELQGAGDEITAGADDVHGTDTIAAAAGDELAELETEPGGAGEDASGDHQDEPDLIEKARLLVADGAGRPRLVKELGISDHQAKQVLAEIKEKPTNGKAVLT